LTPPTAKAEDESRDYDDILERAFRIPHDRPPGWLLVFTAYVDETAHDRPDGTFVAGFMGNEASWKTLAKGWPKAIHPLKNLHMVKIRKMDRYQTQLIQAASLTKESGLTALVGKVVQNDYRDLIPSWATDEGKIFGAWVLCLTALIVSALDAIPADERLEIYYDRQFQYERFADVVCASIQKTPELASPDGRPKLVFCSPVDRHATQLTQPADYFAYALLQDKNDSTSAKARLTSPILKAHPKARRAEGLLNRETARLIVSRTFQEVALLERGMDI